MRTAHSTGPDYACQHEWAGDCFVQCGGCEKYGFFFEAFPQNPNTFLRGDSKVSIADAEEKVWQKLLKHSSCELDHANPENFEKRKYRNGVGFCVGCGMFASGIFPPSEICIKCGANTYHTCDKDGKWWCEECSKTIPEELLSDFQKLSRRIKSEIEEISDEEFQEGLKQVLEHMAKPSKD